MPLESPRSPPRDTGAMGLLRTVWSALDGPSASLARLRFVGEGDLPSVFAVSDLAAASIGAAAVALSDLAPSDTEGVRIDRRLASLWFGMSLAPEGWAPPPAWDPIARDYAASDGWIRLHTNAPHHRAAALAVLGAPGEKEAVAAAVSRWRADDLEAAIVARGGCAATMRSPADWAAHPQGRSVAAEPLVHVETTGAPGWLPRASDPARPLAGIRVLDLTRVLAGPVATRFLAGFGAQVLRIDPPDWDEPAIVPEVTLGKACARLDLRQEGDRARLRDLLGQADVLVHGYRPGALDGLGFDPQERERLRPGLVEVSLDAYGWTGPWAGRRGFDSLVQMSAGIAEVGMRRLGRDRPTPLPVQALDHATGYLMAAAALRGLSQRTARGIGSRRRVSLARTAALLVDAPTPERTVSLAPPNAHDHAPGIEATQWGPARRLRPPVEIAGVPMGWAIPARALGSAPPSWPA